ncbi:hypothetical protein F5X99DRAFT_240393 [Biscogniauxia marginata]|nr:hypothetical protein F5X99DRAFT_240393 [Biscogniauxia marginata]
MDFIRTNVLPRRGEPSRGQAPDMEQQSDRPDMVEQPQPQPQPQPELQNRRGRPILRSLFTRESDPGRRDNRRTNGNHGPTSDGDDSPKTPRFNLGMPSTRIRLPSLARTRERGSSRLPSRDRSNRPAQPNPRGASGPQTAIGQAPTEAQTERSHRTEDTEGRRRFRGTDPAELQLADLAEDGRRRRHHHHHSRRNGPDSSRRRRHEHQDPPSRFLFCFPWIESNRMRSQVLRCFVSGMFLMLMLSVYLGLSLTKNINSSEFTILLILVILATTIFFCHGLVRVCLLILRPRDEERARSQLPQYYGPGGYAVPRRPIRVVLARDEEAAGIDSETSKLQPPAYGLWRESVRVDPDRIYWQRNEQHQPSDNDDDERESSEPRQPRPPSYASDDGVEYVVEARPRSIVPTTDTVHIQQQAHPSEASSRTSEWPGGLGVGSGGGSNSRW